MAQPFRLHLRTGIRRIFAELNTADWQISDLEAQAARQ